MKALKCPKCGSNRTESETKKFAAKTVLLGPIGALIDRKRISTCLTCGNKWEIEKS